MRHQRQVAGCQFNRRRLHSLGQKSLELWINRSILRRYLVEARFYPPCGLRGLSGCQRGGPRPLDGVESARAGGVYAVGEIPEEGFLVEPKVPIALYRPCACGRLRELRCECTEVLACIGRTSRHVDQRRDDRISPCFTDKSSCKRMADKDGGS